MTHQRLPVIPARLWRCYCAYLYLTIDRAGASPEEALSGDRGQLRLDTHVHTCLTYELLPTIHRLSQLVYTEIARSRMCLREELDGEEVGLESGFA